MLKSFHNQVLMRHIKYGWGQRSTVLGQLAIDLRWQCASRKHASCHKQSHKSFELWSSQSTIMLITITSFQIQGVMVQFTMWLLNVTHHRGKHDVTLPRLSSTSMKRGDTESLLLCHQLCHSKRLHWRSFEFVLRWCLQVTRVSSSLSCWQCDTSRSFTFKGPGPAARWGVCNY